MNTLFSTGFNLQQTRPYARVSPQHCLAANQSLQCESGMQNLPGWCLVMYWGRWCLGINSANPLAFEVGTVISIPPTEGGFAAGLRGGLPSITLHICSRAKIKYQFPNPQYINCKATTFPPFGIQFKKALRHTLCNANGLQGTSINHFNQVLC